jgi:hemolysin activation/secretion protein
MMKYSRVAALLIAVACVAAAPLSAHAQAPAKVSAPPRFDINRFEVVGNTLLPASELERVFTPYTGPNKDFGDIRRALEALEQAYRDFGYGVVQVLLPEQDITKGIVQFRALQPRVDKVLIEGNTHFDNENIRRSLPTVKEGEAPNSKEIARNLQLVGEHPLKQTSVLLRAGASEDQVDVNIKVTDDKPWRAFLTLDNTGTSDTGYARLGLGLQHTNLFNRDQTLTGQFVTSPTDPDQVAIYGAGYRIPFYDLDSSLDLIAGYSKVDSGTVQGLFNVSGAGTVVLVRWNYILPKWQDTEQKVSFGLDYREYQNQVQLQGSGNIVPDVTIHPLSLSYNGLWREAASELSFYGSFSRNIPGGPDGTEEDWTAGTGGRQTVVDDYKIFRYGFNYVNQFRNEWQVRIGFNGQYTRDALVSGEQYGIGGPDTVRGYPLRELAMDKGNSTQLEFYTPDLARRVGLSDSFRVRFLAFYDYGWVENNDTQPTDKGSLASTGVGLRLNYGKTLSLRLDFAQLLRETANLDNGSQRVSAGLALIF